MVRIALALCAVAGLVLVNAQAQDSKKDKLDPAKILGTWTYVSVEKDGEKKSKDDLAGQTVVIEKGKLTLKGQQTFVMEYELNTETSPAGIKLKIVESPFGAGAMAKGIIAVHEGELKMCYASEGDAPKAFEAKKDGHRLMILKMAK